MLNKQKVLLVHNYYQVLGGEDIVVENEKNMLIENGHEVVLYTRHNDEIKNRSLFGKIKLFFETIFSFKTYKQVKGIIKKENIDIVHVHNTLPLISPSVYYAAFSMKVPVVQTIHNFRFLCPGATFTKDGQICEACIEKGLLESLKNKCYRNSFFQTASICLMLKIHRLIGTYKKVNGYITLTEFNKKKLSHLIKDNKRLFVKPNFVKSNNDEATERQIENYFVFIGRLDKLKGTDLLVEAWKDIKDSTLYIIGDGHERENIENYIKDNKIDNIKMLGFMKREQAFKIIQKSRAIIIPSQWYEGFPMTIVESFSLGVPVIAGNIGNLESIIDHNETGLIFEYDKKEELINVIKKLAEDTNLNKRLSISAKKIFIENYTNEINYSQLIDIYRKLAGEKHENVQYTGC